MIPRELASYVRAQKLKGVSLVQLWNDLQAAGWPESEIRLALWGRPATGLPGAQKTFRTLANSLVGLFALVGVVLVGAYFAVRWHFTDTKGIIDSQADAFWQQGRADIGDLLVPEVTGGFFSKENYCALTWLKEAYPAEFKRILDLALSGQEAAAAKILHAVRTAQGHADADDCQGDVSRQSFEQLGGRIDEQSPFQWANSKEWTFFKGAVVQDKTVLARVAKETGIPSRMIVAQLVAEQMRLFYSNRPWFENAIAPLKVLGSMTKFSWGVLGIKPDTAARVEANLKDSTSPFYPGPDWEHALDFNATDINQERFNRITANADHYYAYLYAALYDKEVIAQWQKSGYPIAGRPEILATLYNIGFAHSIPNENPQSGGATLTINGQQISFGRLAYEFYYSNELLDEFPF